MLNFNPESGIESLKSNQRAIAAHVDDDHYVRRLTPGMFVPFATATHGTAGQSVGLGKWPTIDYPNAVSSYAVFATERPRFWLSGRMLVTIYYTSQTAGVADFAILLAVYSVPSNGNLSNTGITTLHSGGIALAAPGPAAADDEKSIQVYTTVSFDPSARRIGIRIGRDGGSDANNNILQVTEVVVQHVPALRESA